MAKWIWIGVMLQASTVCAQVQLIELEPLPGDIRAGANCVSADGSVIVGASISSTGARTPFRWTEASGMVPIEMPSGWVNATPVCMSSDGQVVGLYARPTATGVDRPFRWQYGQGPAAQLAGLTAAGSCVVSSGSADGTVLVGDGNDPLTGERAALRWVGMGEPVRVPMPAGYTAASALGVSADGSIIGATALGFGQPGGNYGRAYLWTAQTGSTFMGEMPEDGLGWSVRAMSLDGSVVVGDIVFNRFPNGVIDQWYRWTPGGGMLLLPTLNPELQHRVRGVSADGSVVFGSNIQDAILWTAEGGSQRFADYLETRYGFELPVGWTFAEAWALSHDRKTFIMTIRTYVPAPQFKAVVMRLPNPVGCYANCDASVVSPIINVADFTCFLQRFASGEPYANCDESTSQPVLNVADFTCFLQRFAAGCQ